MQPSLIITALRGAIPAVGDNVSGAIDLTQLDTTSENPPTPWVYVNLGSDSVSQIGNIQLYEGDITETYNIVLKLDNTTNQNDTLGWTVQDAIETYRLIFTKLLHNRDLDGLGELFYQGNSLLGQNSANVWWNFQFGRKTFIDASDGWQITDNPTDSDVDLQDLLKMTTKYNPVGFDPTTLPVATDEVEFTP